MKFEPTIDQLRALIKYDPATGKLTWRRRTLEMVKEAGRTQTQKQIDAWNWRYAGDPALCGIDGFGYYQGAIFSTYFKAHRVAWAIHYGEWPRDKIDHINGNNRDNRICNLRDVDHGTNLRNCRKSIRNTSGANGVNLNRKTGKWFATIRAGGRTVRIGTFLTFDEAKEAREKAEREYGYSNRHGKDDGFGSRAYVKKADRDTSNSM